MKRCLALLVTAYLAACGSEKIEDELDTKPKDKGPPAYSLTVDLIEFEQGFERSYDLADKAQVPRGMPVMSIENLPEDAKFDGKVLTWKPSCNLPPEFFERGYGYHRVRVILKSTEDDEQFVARDMGIVVHPFVEYEDRKCGQP